MSKLTHMMIAGAVTALAGYAAVAAQQGQGSEGMGFQGMSPGQNTGGDPRTQQWTQHQAEYQYGIDKQYCDTLSYVNREAHQQCLQQAQATRDKVFGSEAQATTGQQGASEAPGIMNKMTGAVKEQLGEVKEKLAEYGIGQGPQGQGQAQQGVAQGGPAGQFGGGQQQGFGQQGMQPSATGGCNCQQQGLGQGRMTGQSQQGTQYSATGQPQQGVAQGGMSSNQFGGGQGSVTGQSQQGTQYLAIGSGGQGVQHALPGGQFGGQPQQGVAQGGGQQQGLGQGVTGQSQQGTGQRQFGGGQQQGSWQAPQTGQSRNWGDVLSENQYEIQKQFCDTLKYGNPQLHEQCLQQAQTDRDNKGASSS